jgi:hypothetical protein
VILRVVELVSDELLGFQHVGRDDVGLGAHGAHQRFAVGVDHRVDAQPLELGDEAGVDVDVDVARQGPGEHAEARSLGQVEQLVDEQLDLLLGDVRAALVDLGLLAGGGSITAVLVRESSRMRTKSLRPTSP